MNPVTLGLLGWLGFNALLLVTAVFLAATGSDPGRSNTAHTEAPSQGQQFAPDGPVGGPAATPSGAAVSKRQCSLASPLLRDVRDHRGEHEVRS